MTRPVVVVGGGTTGCITALRLADAGRTVVLLEGSAALGGIMRDHAVGDTGYLRGCQYVEATAPWRPLAAASFDAHTTEVAHHMGAVTVLDGEAHVLDGMAVPAMPGPIPAITGGDARSLAERLAGYGAWGPALTAFVARAGHDVAELDASCALGLQLSRVFPRDAAPADVLAAKAASPLADARLAARRGDRGVAPPRSIVPIAGWSPVFDDMAALLASRGVDVRLRATARAALDDGRLVVTGRDLPVDAAVVWAANPVPLAGVFGLPRLDNRWTASTSVHCDVRGWDGPLPFYVQRFDAASPILRVYVYRWGDTVRACIECYGTIGADAAPAIVREAAATCVPWAPAARLELAALEPHRRHHLLTVRDVLHLHELEARMRAAGSVPGAWVAYGREQKLDAIAADARALGLLPEAVPARAA